MSVREFNVSTKCRGIVVIVSRPIGDDVVAPVIKHFAMRIRKAVSDVALKLSTPWLPTINRPIAIPYRSPTRLHLRPMKYSVTQIDRASRLECHRVGLMMRIRRVEPVEDALHQLPFSITIGVPRIPQIRRLHHHHPILIKLEPCGAVQVIQKGRALRRLSISPNIKNQQLVPLFTQGTPLRIVFPCRNP